VDSISEEFLLAYAGKAILKGQKYGNKSVACCSDPLALAQKFQFFYQNFYQASGHHNPQRIKEIGERPKRESSSKNVLTFEERLSNFSIIVEAYAAMVVIAPVLWLSPKRADVLAFLQIPVLELLHDKGSRKHPKPLVAESAFRRCANKELHPIFSLWISAILKPTEAGEIASDSTQERTERVLVGLAAAIFGDNASASNPTLALTEPIAPGEAGGGQFAGLRTVTRPAPQVGLDAFTVARLP